MDGRDDFFVKKYLKWSAHRWVDYIIASKKKCIYIFPPAPPNNPLALARSAPPLSPLANSLNKFFASWPQGWTPNTNTLLKNLDSTRLDWRNESGGRESCV